jgi:hypothetical protein
VPLFIPEFAGNAMLVIGRENPLFRIPGFWNPRIMSTLFLC